MNIQDLQNLVVMPLREVFAPTRIILFGSHAWGNPDSSSDVDICVLVRSSDVSPLQRAVTAHEALGTMPFAKDILVQTDDEFERYSIVEGTLQHRIAHEGQVLYDHTA
jgi:predicted nucleotidyltransferase